MKEELAALVERISAAADETGAWSIRSEEAARTLGIETVAFWRAVHAARDRISFGDAIDGWSHDSVGDLVSVLEELGFPEAEAALTRAGLYLPHELAVNLTEELVFRAQSLSAGHVVREEDLAAMLRHTGSVRESIGIYLREHVDLDALIDGWAESFRLLQGMPETGRTLAARYLRGMFTRHVLDERSMLAGLVERLRLAAARLGHGDPEARSHGRGPTEGGVSGRSARLSWARKVMGVERGELSAEGLRASYRRLMMRLHPDVDPTGLERCKDVNAAYSLLIAEFSAQA